MLRNHKLLVDQDCPMCNLYGKCFTKFGMVDHETVAPYQSIDQRHADKIDMERAKNEIALFEVNTKETYYGIDALIKIVLGSQSTFASILKLPLFYIPLKKIYKFISFNRKVIYPTQTKLGEARSCEPESNVKYRVLYILFVAMLTGLILNQFLVGIKSAFGFPENPFLEYVICLGQVVWQGIAIITLNKNKILDYLGNMSTVSLMGAIILVPYFILDLSFDFGTYVDLAFFSCVVLFMFFEHIRRCGILNLGFSMTFSWLAYRFSVLFVLILSIYKFY